MKIDFAIVSSNESEYLDFWPVIKQAWERINIKPILFKISDKEGWENDNIYNLPAIDKIKTSFQSQVARIWAYKILKGNLITSDIDMLPISAKYFHSNSEHSEEYIVSYCSDAKEKFGGTEPMCYVLANNSVMEKLIEYNTWKEFIENLAMLTGSGWGADQWYLTKTLKKHDKVAYLKRGWNSAGVANNRIDRIGWAYNEKLLRGGYYYDAHLLRPFKEHEKSIMKLWDTIHT